MGFVLLRYFKFQSIWKKIITKFIYRHILMLKGFYNKPNFLRSNNAIISLNILNFKYFESWTNNANLKYENNN